MKIIIYYLLLLIAIALITGFSVSGNANAMSMQQAFSLSAALVLYTVALSLVGEGKAVDERETAHRYIANRSALIAGTIIMSLGIMSQLFFTHKLDYWLLIGLVGINLTKIISLIYLNYKR